MAIINIPTPDQVAEAMGRTLTAAEVVFFHELVPVVAQFNAAVQSGIGQVGAEAVKLQGAVTGDLVEKIIPALTSIRVVDGLVVDGSFQVRFSREPKQS